MSRVPSDPMSRVSAAVSVCPALSSTLLPPLEQPQHSSAQVRNTDTSTDQESIFKSVSDYSGPSPNGMYC